MSISDDILKKNRAFHCLECGKCTAVCPISSFNDNYSPRRMLSEGIFYGTDDLISNNLLWSCLTCQLCSQRCPVDVRFSEYIKDVRFVAHRNEEWGKPAHVGALHHIMEMTAAPDLRQNRTGWITDELRVKDKGDVLYFVGCLPYYQDFFGSDFGFSPISIARDTIRILNHLDIEPVVMSNERCCGHDLFWLGKQDKFVELGKLNLMEIKQTGAKTVVTACPECALTLSRLYKEQFGEIDFEVKHIAEVVAENINDMQFNALSADITYHDPCRLGRYLGIYDQPRQVMSAIPGVNLKEMPQNKRGALCCGTTNWMNCDATSKQMQVARLTEAKTTGAEKLVTACPKCQIHFRCSECGDESTKVDIELIDFVNIVASALKT